MAYKCSPMTLRLVFPFLWIRALIVHLLLRFQLGGRGGTHTPRRTLIIAAPGICNLPCCHPLHPNCQYIAVPPGRNLHNIKFAECRSSGLTDPLYLGVSLGNVKPLGNCSCLIRGPKQVGPAGTSSSARSSNCN